MATAEELRKIHLMHLKNLIDYEIGILEELPESTVEGCKNLRTSQVLKDYLVRKYGRNVL